MTHEHLKPDEIAMKARAEKAVAAEDAHERDLALPHANVTLSYGAMEQAQIALGEVCGSAEIRSLLTRLANERAKLAAVQDALKFYADKENYIADAQDEPSPADYERGDRARSALRRINELEKQHGKT